MLAKKISWLWGSVLLLAAVTSGQLHAEQAVTVSTIEQFSSALQAGAHKIYVEPGEYLVTEPMYLENVKVEGKGCVGSGNGVRFIVDAFASDFGGLPGFSLAGKISMKNIEFTGFDFADFDQPSAIAYIGLAPFTSELYDYTVTIRKCRFVSGWQTGFSSVAMLTTGGQFGQSAHLKFKFCDNYVEGSAGALFVVNGPTESTDVSIDAIVKRNEFRYCDNAINSIGQVLGNYGVVNGLSEDNLFFEAWNYSLILTGGTEDPANPAPLGGNLAKVNWKSYKDRFVNHFIGMAVWGGHRHGNNYGSSASNCIAVEIVEPTFEQLEAYEIPSSIPPYFEFIFEYPGYLDWYLRDIDVLGGSAYETLPANALSAEVLAPGSNTKVSLHRANFATVPGRIWIKNQTNDIENTGSDRFNPVPGMDPFPNYGNTAVFAQSYKDFKKSNGKFNVGYNQIPKSYFKKCECKK